MPDDWQTRLLSWPGAGSQPHDPSVVGYDDLVVRAAAAVDEGSDVVAALPRSTLHVVAGGTHMMGRERPDEIASLIIGHLS
jgi:pimeloyl-ACP methyl ester carboxylesterase